MFPVKNHTRIEEMLQADVRDDLPISEFDPTAPARSSTEQIRLFEPVNSQENTAPSLDSRPPTRVFHDWSSV